MIGLWRIIRRNLLIYREIFCRCIWKMGLNDDCNAFLSNAGQLGAWAMCGG